MGKPTFSDGSLEALGERSAGVFGLSLQDEGIWFLNP
jgi:hypothetical protein